jgi:RNA polymerase sigma factor (sigma-70 family)
MEGEEHPVKPLDLEAMFRSLLKSGIKLARRATPIGADAEDLNAEAVAATYYRRLEDPDCLSTADERERYVNTVIRNRGIRAGRHEQVRNRKTPEMSRYFDDRHAESSIDPDERYDARRMSGLVATAREKLTPKDQEVLHMCYWEEMEPHEAAEILGEAPGTIRARLRRAIAKLRMDESLDEFNPKRKQS